MALSCKGADSALRALPAASDTAAHLVDRVIPQVPVRQWVLSLPRRARFLLVRNPQLITRTLDVGLRAIFAHVQVVPVPVKPAEGLHWQPEVEKLVLPARAISHSFAPSHAGA